MLPDKTSKHVGTATELTCLIPIKPGFLPVLDTRTYATRLRVVFKVLQALRVASREARALRPVLDIVEAARTVHAFSWAIVAERQLLLSVSFDRPWEPYIRVIWKDLGPLLDLFLCNCEGFVPSTGAFEPFAAFVRRHQVETGFFYPSSSLTVDDQQYLLELEKLQREGAADFEMKAATLVAKGAETRARDARTADPEEARRQWLSVLNVLYGLRNMYPEDSEDHEYLRRAARALLEASRPTLPPPSSPELEWFEKKSEPQPGVDPREVERREIQGGILTPYKRISHGCLLLARVETPAEARKFIRQIVGEVTREERTEPADGVYVNVAFTFNGLRQLGVMESALARFPKEFRVGMDARAGLLGDVRQNHPDNWKLPEWNVRFTKDGTVQFTGSLDTSSPSESAIYSSAADSSATTPPVRMSTVDMVVILHQAKAWARPHQWAPEHPLHKRVEKFCRDALEQGIRVLSVQPLVRYSNPRKGDEKSFSYDHFRFLDGISQPIPADIPHKEKPDEVEMGELLVGFQNSRRDPPFPQKSADPMAVRGSLIDNGSFLVVRKLRQNVKALNDALERAEKKPSLDREVLLTKMMGRSRAGVPLIREPSRMKGTNDFNFSDDSTGEVCPFHAHIRRGNPRLQTADDGTEPPPVPRIARRGLAYGPLFNESQPDDVDRGMMFMAYNASIAEQFEIIQRWMSGGNTPAENNDNGVFSGQPDPLLGLPDGDGKRTYRFIHDGKPHHVDLGPDPFVTLQWGAYLFVPSIKAFEIIAQEPGADKDMARDVVAFGNSVIDNLKTLDHWAAVLEDASAIQSGTTAAVCAAIRATRGGVMRTPYGVVVANHELGMRVLREDKVFSVREYQRRFERSVGKGYLGMDSGAAYKALSKGPNKALDLITDVELDPVDTPEKQAYKQAYCETKKVLENTVKSIIASVPPPTSAVPSHTDTLVSLPLAAVRRPTDTSLPLPLEPVVDQVLARLAQKWFDIPDGILIKVGGRPKDEQAAKDAVTLHCPFHFLAPSRYVFSSPNPRGKVRQMGEGHGQQLLEAVREFVKRQRQALTLTGPVSKALFQAIPDDDDLLSRTLLGLVFGFVPTVYGNALQVLGQWLGDETFWRVQQRLLAAKGKDPIDWATASVALKDVLHRAMLSRAVPPLLHRTVTGPSELGDVPLKEGDRVVVAVSAMSQEILGQGKPDVMTVFGGNRKDTNSPTHACPGYDIAMGVLLGLLAAILEYGTFTPTPALVTVRVTPFETPQLMQQATV